MAIKNVTTKLIKSYGLEAKHIELIEKLIKSQKAESASEVVRNAISFYYNSCESFSIENVRAAFLKEMDDE